MPLEEETTEFDQKYLPGTENRLMRYYFYLMRGLDILNNFRNLFLGIIAIYIALHFTNYLYLILMFIPALLVLTVVGYYNVHKLSKVTEWLSIRFGTHFQVKQYSNQEEQNQLLREIRDSLKNENKN